MLDMNIEIKEYIFLAQQILAFHLRILKYIKNKRISSNERNITSQLSEAVLRKRHLTGSPQ